jgi:hypothetical protein
MYDDYIVIDDNDTTTWTTVFDGDIAVIGDDDATDTAIANMGTNDYYCY